MEGDRTAFSEETGSKLSKQRNVIKTLKREQNSLLKDLRVATSEGMKRRDTQMMDRLQELIEQHDQYAEHVKTEKTNLNEIEFQIRKVYVCKGLRKFGIFILKFEYYLYLFSVQTKTCESHKFAQGIRLQVFK